MDGVFPALTLVRGQAVYERTADGERFGEAVGQNVRRYRVESFTPRTVHGRVPVTVAVGSRHPVPSRQPPQNASTPGRTR